MCATKELGLAQISSATVKETGGQHRMQWRKITGIGVSLNTAMPHTCYTRELFILV